MRGLCRPGAEVVASVGYVGGEHEDGRASVDELVHDRENQVDDEQEQQRRAGHVPEEIVDRRADCTDAESVIDNRHAREDETLFLFDSRHRLVHWTDSLSHETHGVTLLHSHDTTRLAVRPILHLGAEGAKRTTSTVANEELGSVTRIISA